MKVCHYAIATHLGGAERSLLELARSQLENPELGAEPWVLLPKGDGPLIDELRRARIPYDVLPMPEAMLSISRGDPLRAGVSALLSAPGMAFYLPRLITLLLRRKPGLIHTNAIKCHVLGALAGEIIRRPVIWHLRDIIASGPTCQVLRVLRRLPSVHAIANSRATAEAFEPGSSSRERPIHVVYNGMRESEYRIERNRDFNRELKLPEGAPIVGILGVLAQWKGQAEFLRMASSVIGAGFDAGFVVVGDSIYDTAGDGGHVARGDTYKDALRNLIDQLGLGSRVLFTGFRRDINRVLNGLDVLVHASVRPEPFGRVVVEAMACGVPVIATGAGGILEIVEDEKSGLLVPPGDVPAMAAALKRLLSSPELSAGLVKNGREEFLRRFTHRRYVEGVARVYEAVLSR